jgi:general secretion pathway protein G
MRINFRQFRDTVTAWSRARKVRATDDNAEAGLTLVEMIVVLVIIAVLATMVTMSVINRPDEAKVTTTKTNMLTLSSALKLYRLDNGEYPTTEQGLKALFEKPTAAPVPANWNSEGYVTEMPADAWGHPYVYQAPVPGGYSLMSLGKDGKPGGEGLDADLIGKK